MGFSEFFSSIGNTLSRAADYVGLDGQVGYKTPPLVPQSSDLPSPLIVPSRGAVPTPATKPTTAIFRGQEITTSSPSTSSGFSLGGVGDFLSNLGSTVESGFKTYFGVKSQFEQFNTAQELGEIKLQAIRQSAQQASPAAQVVLPTFQDFLDDPRAASQMVLPAALQGSGALGGGLNILTIGLIGGAIWFATKK